MSGMSFILSISSYTGIDTAKRLKNVKLRAQQTLENVEQWEIKVNQTTADPYSPHRTKAGSL
jgi:hypothetical protein